MARIRTIKPEYWDDEIIGSLTWGARLLFPGSWNFADDEGLVRWSPDFLKASVFKYDTTLTLEDVTEMMRELEDAGFVYVYSSSRARHRIGFIVNFRKHQRIDKPQAAKLPVPNWRDPAVVMVYARRNGFVCRHCNEAINEEFSRDPAARRYDPVCERIKSPAERPSGPDDPSNIAVVHVMCAKDYDPSAAPVPGTFQERSKNDPGSFQEWSSGPSGGTPEAAGPAREAGDVGASPADISVGRVIPGIFPEQSATEGKGREGIGRERNRASAAADDTPGAQLAAVPALPPDEPAASQPGDTEPVALFETTAVEIPSQRQPAAKKAASGRAKAATTAPDSFEVTDALAAWALNTHKIPRDVAVSQTQVFLDSHRAKGNTFKDWTSAWRTWMARVPVYSPQLLRGASPIAAVNSPAAYQNPKSNAGYSGGWRRPSA